MIEKPSLDYDPAPRDDSPVKFGPIDSIVGEEDGLTFGAGNQTISRAVFNEVVWPLMPDLEREDFVLKGVCDVYR